MERMLRPGGMVDGVLVGVGFRVRICAIVRLGLGHARKKGRRMCIRIRGLCRAFRRYSARLRERKGLLTDDREGEIVHLGQYEACIGYAGSLACRTTGCSLTY
jgi:hypothetical protein